MIGAADHRPQCLSEDPAAPSGAAGSFICPLEQARGSEAPGSASAMLDGLELDARQTRGSRVWKGSNC